MSEIKPVYQVRQLGEWIEVDKNIFDELYIQNKFPHRILYPAAAYEALQKENAELTVDKNTCRGANEGLRRNLERVKAENAAQAKRIAELEEDLQFVERWANHHGTKPNVTEQEALSCIQHYPSIAAITKSYKDGVIPSTRNPYAEIESLRKQVEEMLTAMRRAVLALAFAAESSAAMKDDYNALSAAIAKAASPEYQEPTKDE